PGLADDWIVNLAGRVLEALEPSASVAPLAAPDAGSGSVNAAAAVHDERLASHEVAVVGGEEDERPHEILRHLRPLQHPRPDILLLALVRDVALVVTAQREPRGDGVHADAKLPQLPGQRAGESHHAALGSRVVDVVRNALEEGARRDVDDRALA